MDNYIGEYHDRFQVRGQLFTDVSAFLEGNHDIIWPKSLIAGGHIVKWRYVPETLYWCYPDPSSVPDEAKEAVRSYLLKRDCAILSELGFYAYAQAHESIRLRLGGG